MAILSVIKNRSPLSTPFLFLRFFIGLFNVQIHGFSPFWLFYLPWEDIIELRYISNQSLEASYPVGIICGYRVIDWIKLNC